MEKPKIETEEDPVLMEEREKAKKVVKGTRYSLVRKKAGTTYSPKYTTTRKKAGTTYSPKY